MEGEEETLAVEGSRGFGHVLRLYNIRSFSCRVGLGNDLKSSRTQSSAKNLHLGLV